MASSIEATARNEQRARAYPCADKRSHDSFVECAIASQVEKCSAKASANRTADSPSDDECIDLRLIRIVILAEQLRT